MRRKNMSIALVSALTVMGVTACSDSSAPSSAENSEFTRYDADSTSITIGSSEYPLSLAGPAHIKVSDKELKVADAGADAGLEPIVAYQPAAGNQQFYFAMTDRFANGDTGKDDGGLGGDRLTSGYDPTDSGFYHGGDLRGIIDKLDYIEALGTTAIWITPPFTNQAVQGQSAAYHGYWITDFTKVDPHFGTKEDLQELIDKAHGRGMKVYLDVITNHTADIISYVENEYTYKESSAVPYTDEQGKIVDVKERAGAHDFPELDPTSSFPYTPENSAVKKVPDWLNDVSYYHNRGNSTWVGESVTFGDFDGLDDLMTEDPDVVKGMIDIYSDWAKMGVDGFRIDTVKHVNMEFWEEWTAAISAAGGEDFFMFGEVYETDPKNLSRYARVTDMDAVLDFGFQEAVVGFANGGTSEGLSTLFAQDSLYVSPDSSPANLPTFLGNHDMGRVGYLINGSPKSDRVKFAHELMFAMRGQPVIYYGDEQGFAGTGGDKAARQSLFATQVPAFQEQALIDGTPMGSHDRYGTDGELFTTIKELSEIRKAHPGLAQGAQIELYSEGFGYAFSRIDQEEKVEYVVLANSGNDPLTIEVDPLSKEAGSTLLYASNNDMVLKAGGTSMLTVELRPHSLMIVEMPGKVELGSGITDFKGSVDRTGLMKLAADSPDNEWEESSFYYREVGSDDWHNLGTVLGPDATYYHDVNGFAEGDLLEYRVVDGGGNAHSLLYLVGGPAPWSVD